MLCLHFYNFYYIKIIFVYSSFFNLHFNNGNFRKVFNNKQNYKKIKLMIFKTNKKYLNLINHFYKF